MTIIYHPEVTQGSDEWRTIPEFPDYAASRDGQIKRVHVDARCHRLTGKPLVQSVSKAGYAQVTLCDNGVRKSRRVNRVVCAAFHDPAPTDRHHAAHNDGDRLNNCSSNLRWAIGVENSADKVAHGTDTSGDRHWSRRKPECRPRGIGHGRARLNDDAVRAIRSDNRSQRAIAKYHGVSQRTIWMIKANMIWSHVE